MPKTELSADLERRITAAKGQLDRLTREAEPWQAVRDQLISEAKRAGVSARTIAQAAGVSHTYVAQLDDSVQAPTFTAEQAKVQTQPIVVDINRADLDPELRAAAKAILDVPSTCRCTERGASILGSCRGCGHDGADHDQNGCHHAR